MTVFTLAMLVERLLTVLACDVQTIRHVVKNIPYHSIQRI